MATYSKQLLSGSADGLGILVATTASPGTTVHTAHTTSYDEIFLFASNAHTAAVDLTVEWGGTSDPGNLLVKALSLPPNSPPVPIAPGLVLTNGKVASAFASVASKVVIVGFVNRIT